MEKLPISHILVINMRQDEDRLKRVREELFSHKLRFERIDAVDGRRLSLASRMKWGSKFLSSSIIGCALSHIKAWTRVVEGGLVNSLILEDDVTLDEHFVKKARKMMQRIPADYDIIFFGRNGVREDGSDFFSSLLHPIFSHWIRKPREVAPGIMIPGFVCGFHAYLVSRKGALKLLQLSRRIKFHIDAQISFHLRGLKAYALKSPIVWGQTRENDSTIGSKSPWLLNWLVSGIDLDYDFSLNWGLSEKFGQIGDADIRIWNVLFVLFSFLISLGSKKIGLFLFIWFTMMISGDLLVNSEDLHVRDLLTSGGDICCSGLGLVLGSMI